MVYIALNTAATGMAAFEKVTNVIANNLANSQTPGFKREMAIIETLGYMDQKKIGTNPQGTAIVPTGVQIGVGARVAAIGKVNSQGELKQTDNNLDVAIIGAGYFMVQLPDGSMAYTRDGNFTKSPSGQMVTNQGYVLQPGINIPNDTLDITISSNGTVSVSQPGSPIQTTIVGTINIANFVNPGGLTSKEGNLLIENESSGPPIIGLAEIEGRGSLQQGFIESSNVSPVTEMTSLITTQRSYEMVAKVMHISDQMYAAVVSAKA